MLSDAPVAKLYFISFIFASSSWWHMFSLFLHCLLHFTLFFIFIVIHGWLNHVVGFVVATYWSMMFCGLLYTSHLLMVQYHISLANVRTKFSTSLCVYQSLHWYTSGYFFLIASAVGCYIRINECNLTYARQEGTLKHSQKLNLFLYQFLPRELFRDFPNWFLF